MPNPNTASSHPQPEGVIEGPEQRSNSMVVTKARGDVSRLFDLECTDVSPIRFKPQNFQNLPPDVLATVINGVQVYREEFQAGIFGDVPVNVKGHLTHVDNISPTFSEETGFQGSQVIVFHNPNVADSPVYDPKTGEFIQTVGKNKDLDFPLTPKANQKHETARPKRTLFPKNS